MHDYADEDRSSSYQLGATLRPNECSRLRTPTRHIGLWKTAVDTAFPAQISPPHCLAIAWWIV